MNIIAKVIIPGSFTDTGSVIMILKRKPKIKAVRKILAKVVKPLLR